MSIEQFSSNESLRNVESIVTAHPEVAGFQSYEYFRNNESEQRKAFIAGERQHLELSYPELEAGSVATVAQPAEGALRLLMGSGNNSDKARSLYDAIEYRFSEMALVGLAAQLTDPSLKGDERAETLSWFKATNEALYGAPKPEVFAALANKNIFSHLGNSVEDETAEAIRQELSALVGKNVQTDYQPYRADDITVGRLSRLVRDRFDTVVDHIDESHTYDVADMVASLDTSLRKIGGDKLGWKVEIIQNSSALATSPHQKIVEVGEKRKALEGSELKAKTIHELGIHAMRSINALRAGWLSAAYGQEGYLPFEEAAATALEDAYKGKFVDHGVDYYLIAGLAYGIDEHEPRDFREVYEIMWRANALKASASGELSDESIEKAKSKAFTNCMRVFRGTTTTDKGVIYSKDLAYFDGQELAWSVLDKVQSTEDLELILMGKLDLTKEEHLKIAQQIAETNQNANL